MTIKLNHELYASRESLQRLWEKGLSGLKLLAEHTAVTDSFLVDRFAEINGGDNDFALVALGGYGRGELFPYSDIDLMVLHGRWVKSRQIEEAVERILYPLWDAGLEVGHSVRTIAQCITDCKHDFHLQVAMLDARRIAGSEKMYSELTANYVKKFIDGRRKDFLKCIQAEKDIRLKQFGGNSYQLEPNIKEGRGGLRDIQSMLWTARVVYGLKRLSGIEDSGIFRPEDREALEENFNTLVMIRNRLHYLSGRKCDQLYIEHQEEIAAALGYKNMKGSLGVEIFMQEVYGHLQNVALTTDLFFEHIHETIEGGINSRRERLGNGLEIIQGRIHLSALKFLADKPQLLMKIFLHMTSTGLPIHFQTRQVISANLNLVDNNFRSSKRAAGMFMEIISSTANPLPALSTMLETGFLSAFIPEFGSLEFLAQHDVFHVFTVDRHLLQTIHELSSLKEEHKKIFAEVDDPRILFLAGLLHDIGKGSGNDHSQAGAAITIEIARRFQLNEEETGDLEFLVRNHLYLSHIGQRRDLEDEEVIFECARKIGSNDRLKMLYLLSIADARATGPKAWSEWKGALLQELFLRVGHVLNHGEIIDPDLSQASDWMRSQVSDIVKNLSTDLLALPDDYLLSYTPQEVAEHIALQGKLENGNAMIVPSDHGVHWSVLVVSRDRPGFLSKVCGTLALNNLNVLSAKVNTWQNGTVIDVLAVNPVFRKSFIEQDWKILEMELNLALENKIGLAHRLADKKKAGRSDQAPEHKHYSTSVRFDNKSSRDFTIIEVFAEDQPSLLYDICRTMADFELNITKAMISTRAGQLIDVFYVVDREGAKLTEARNMEEIRKALVYAAESRG